MPVLNEQRMTSTRQLTTDDLTLRLPWTFRRNLIQRLSAACLRPHDETSSSTGLVQVCVSVYVVCQAGLLSVNLRRVRGMTGLPYPMQGSVLQVHSYSQHVNRRLRCDQLFRRELSSIRCMMTHSSIYVALDSVDMQLPTNKFTVCLAAVKRWHLENDLTLNDSKSRIEEVMVTGTGPHA